MNTSVVRFFISSPSIKTKYLGDIIWKLKRTGFYLTSLSFLLYYSTIFIYYHSIIIVIVRSGCLRVKIKSKDQKWCDKVLKGVATRVIQLVPTRPLNTKKLEFDPNNMIWTGRKNVFFFFFDYLLSLIIIIHFSWRDNIALQSFNISSQNVCFFDDDVGHEWKSRWDSTSKNL